MESHQCNPDTDCLLCPVRDVCVYSEHCSQEAMTVLHNGIEQVIMEQVTDE